MTDGIKDALLGSVFAYLILHLFLQPSFAMAQNNATPAESIVIIQNETKVFQPDLLAIIPQSCGLTLPSWVTYSERLIWGQICKTGSADMSEWAGRTCADDQPEVDLLDLWRVSNEFMKLILTAPDYIAARPTTQISFYCVYIPELDLQEHRLPGTLRLENSTFGDVDISDARIDGMLDMDGSHVFSDFWAFRIQLNGPLLFEGVKLDGEVSFQDAQIEGFATFGKAKVVGGLDMQRSRIQQSLFLREGASFSEVNLIGAEIGSNLEASGSTFTGQINGGNLSVTGDVLFGDGASFTEVNLLGADIGRNLTAHGSTFTGIFSASNLTAGQNVFLRGGASFTEVELLGANIGGNLETDGSTFSDEFDADSITIGGSVFLRDGATFAELNLNGADIGRNLDAEGATFAGKFNAGSLTAGGSVFLRGGASFTEVDLLGANIGSNLETDGSTFSDEFDADSITIGGSVFLRDGATFAELNLNGADIGGNLETDGSTFSDRFNAQNLVAGGNVFLRDAASFAEIDLNGAQIRSHLQLQGSTFAGEIDLTEAEIGSLLLWRSTANDVDGSKSNAAWLDGASLILRNAKLGSLQARMRNTDDIELDSWHTKNGARLPADINGMSYGQLGGYSSSIENDLLHIDVNALINWVSNITPLELSVADGYRPQPYRALESALSQMGAEEAAREVSFARYMHRADSRISADKVNDWQTWIRQRMNLFFDRVLQFTVGFGVYPIRTFYWFFGLVFFGVIIARKTKRFCNANTTDCFWYSLDNALPLVQLSENHKNTHSETWVRSFFHFQKVAGLLLASILVGALTLAG